MLYRQLDCVTALRTADCCRSNADKLFLCAAVQQSLGVAVLTDANVKKPEVIIWGGGDLMMMAEAAPMDDAIMRDNAGIIVNWL